MNTKLRQHLGHNENIFYCNRNYLILIMRYDPKRKRLPGNLTLDNQNVKAKKEIELMFDSTRITNMMVQMKSVPGAPILQKYSYRSTSSRYRAIVEGLDSSSLSDLHELIGGTQASLALILDLTEPTLRKHIKSSNKLNLRLSEHIIQLFDLYKKGLDTFGSLKEFRNWLLHNNIGIDARPMDMLSAITGIGIVKNELMRIEFGATA